MSIDDLPAAARSNVESILRLAIEHEPERRALVLFDRESPLAGLLADAWRAALPGAEAIELPGGAVGVPDAVARLAPRDLVVLVESTRFFPEEHRFRVRLFERGLAVVELPHLSRVAPGEEAAYVDALAYDPSLRTIGGALKERLDRASEARLLGDGAVLTYSGGFEESRLNVGDYRRQRNVGGQFPIGEVFTELRDLAGVDGEAVLFAFGDSDFRVAAPERGFRIRVERGVVTAAPGAPAAFAGILDAIRRDEEIVRVRELGLGLNRAFTRTRRVSDVGAYERMSGVHLSLGSKHAIYSKPGFSKRRTKYHVDVFAAVDRFRIDGIDVFDGEGFFDPGADGTRVLDEGAVPGVEGAEPS
ncbi:MAG TPA: hypothetical protein VFS34_01820 [Thermoanaerobaculia bacterium]|nr:hypothetical protein [Thermoanaerobaculia bacterium]